LPYLDPPAFAQRSNGSLHRALVAAHQPGQSFLADDDRVVIANASDQQV
jgi:hypothetical protein